MTLVMYARRKQWPLEWVTGRLRHAGVHATESVECESKDARLEATYWMLSKQEAYREPKAKAARRFVQAG